jgi:uncharacterized membrane protein
MINEIIIALIPIILGLGAIALSPNHDFLNQGFPSTDTPDFFPSLVGIFLILIGFGLLKNIKRSEEIQQLLHEIMVAKAVYQTIIIFLLYWLTISFLGFILSSGFAIAAIILVFGERLKFTTLLYIVSLPCLVFLVFKYAAKVYLPSISWL